MWVLQVLQERANAGSVQWVTHERHFFGYKKKKKLDLKHALWKMCEPFCVETGIFAIQISKPHKKLKDVFFLY